jgi:hypothetical protein
MSFSPHAWRLRQVCPRINAAFAKESGAIGWCAPDHYDQRMSDVPKVIRILGEDLVIFRDKSGDLGLLHKHCIQRGASLEFGIPQEHGIRCCCARA